MFLELRGSRGLYTEGIEKKMTYQEFFAKYGIPVEDAHHINPRHAGKVFSRDFYVYDLNQPSSERDEMYRLMNESPEWQMESWTQRGPCSNWGYRLWRLENEEEMRERFKKQIEAGKARKAKRSAANKSLSYV